MMQTLTFEAIERFNESQLYDFIADICRGEESVRFILNWQSLPVVSDPHEIETWCAGLILKKERYRMGGIWLGGAIGRLAVGTSLLQPLLSKGYWIFEFTPQMSSL